MKGKFVSGIAVLITITGLFSARAFAQPDINEIWRWHPMMWGWWGIPMFLLMALFWGGVIVGIILLVKTFFPTAGASEKETALDILKKRYAKGEIEKEEFEEKKRQLVS